MIDGTHPPRTATPGIHSRLKKESETKSQGLPKHYSNKFEWASAWVDQHGVTLPPDTPELRSLRNWFCYKVDQHKKGRLGADNEASLAHYAIDLTQYEALNTGRGERESDKPFIVQLKAWRETYGSYDLKEDAPDGLIGWQDKLLKRVESDGISRRMKEILQDLPELNVGLWLRPHQPVPDAATVNWWEKAAEYEALAQRCPCFKGQQHPSMPQDMQDWAIAQQAAAASGLLSSRSTGWMRGIGLLRNKSRERVQKLRNDVAMDMRGGEQHLDQYGANDKRLGSIRGAISAIVAVQNGRSDRALCAEYDISPEMAVEVRKTIARLVKDQKWQKNEITACRLLCLSAPKAFSPSYFKALELMPGARPVSLTPAVVKLGTIAWKLAAKWRSASPITRSTTHGAEVESPNVSAH